MTFVYILLGARAKLCILYDYIINSEDSWRNILSLTSWTSHRKVYCRVSTRFIGMSINLDFRHLIKSQNPFGTRLLVSFSHSIFSLPIFLFLQRQHNGGSGKPMYENGRGKGDQGRGTRLLMRCPL